MARDGRVFALILAAGQSRRLGRPKQMLELDGRTLVTHVVERALAASVDAVVVVTGAHASVVELELIAQPVYQVFNPRFAEGQGTSLAAGVRAMPAECEAAIVLLGDTPTVSSDTVSRVADAWRGSRAPAIIAGYGERRGHPVLFDRSQFRDLAALEGDEGGRSVLDRLGDRVIVVDIGIAKPPADVDTEADWVALQEAWPGVR